MNSKWKGTNIGKGLLSEELSWIGEYPASKEEPFLLLPLSVPRSALNISLSSILK